MVAVVSYRSNRCLLSVTNDDSWFCLPLFCPRPGFHGIDPEMSTFPWKRPETFPYQPGFLLVVLLLIIKTLCSTWKIGFIKEKKQQKQMNLFCYLIKLILSIIGLFNWYLSTDILLDTRLATVRFAENFMLRASENGHKKTLESLNFWNFWKWLHLIVL